MPGATSGKFSVKSCGKAHAWCAECRPEQAVAQRKPKRSPKVHTRSCRNCGSCDECRGFIAPIGKKVCRACGKTKAVTAFAFRADTGGRRNQCMECRNDGQRPARCGGCGKTFMRLSAGRTLCASCRPPLAKPCQSCGKQFIGSMDQRRYCSPSCRGEALDAQRKAAYTQGRTEALRAYGGPIPACSCCGETIIAFLALDHVNGGGRKHRQETGGGGFYSWLRRNNYPSGFRVLCHNCNQGRQISGGRCPHEEEN